MKPLAIFAETVAAGSMSAAARRLGMSPSAVSQAIRALEAQGGVTLLHRSTRKLALTEVKSTQKAEYRMPSMNSRTKQMSDYWSSDRSQKAGMDAVEETDFTDGEIDKIVVQVDVERDIVSIWGVDGAGKRDDNAPEMTLALEDLVRFVDAINADEV